jgi:hypothetical protein
MFNVANALLPRSIPGGIRGGCDPIRPRRERFQTRIAKSCRLRLRTGSMSAIEEFRYGFLRRRPT